MTSITWAGPRCVQEQKKAFSQKVHFIQKYSVTQNTVFQYVKKNIFSSNPKLIFFTKFNLAMTLMWEYKTYPDTHDLPHNPQVFLQIFLMREPSQPCSSFHLGQSDKKITTWMNIEYVWMYDLQIFCWKRHLSDGLEHHNNLQIKSSWLCQLLDVDARYTLYVWFVDLVSRRVLAVSLPAVQVPYFECYVDQFSF